MSLCMFADLPEGVLDEWPHILRGLVALFAGVYLFVGVSSLREKAPSPSSVSSRLAGALLLLACAVFVWRTQGTNDFINLWHQLRPGYRWLLLSVPVTLWCYGFALLLVPTMITELNSIENEQRRVELKNIRFFTLLLTLTGNLLPVAISVWEKQLGWHHSIYLLIGCVSLFMVFGSHLGAVFAAGFGDRWSLKVEQEPVERRNVLELP